MFQFPWLAHWLAVCWNLLPTGCPIRKFTDRRLFAPTRNLSQLITSFFASESLGIPHVPLSCFISYELDSRTYHTYNNQDKFDRFFIYLLLFLLFTCSCLHHVKDLDYLHYKQLRCKRKLWRITDSNRWPPACKAGALASWANPPFFITSFVVVPGRVELPTSTLSV